MLAIEREPRPEAVEITGKQDANLICVPVEWRRPMGFVCVIEIREGGPENVPQRRGPVRLRVSKAAADPCRLEIYCGETGLCGVSVG
jgi:hypothetical protein